MTGRRAALGGDPLDASSLHANLPGLADSDVYVCGPASMAESVTAALRVCGVPRRQIHVESFAL